MFWHVHEEHKQRVYLGCHRWRCSISLCIFSKTEKRCGFRSLRIGWGCSGHTYRTRQIIKLTKKGLFYNKSCPFLSGQGFQRAPSPFRAHLTGNYKQVTEKKSLQRQKYNSISCHLLFSLILKWFLRGGRVLEFSCQQFWPYRIFRVIPVCDGLHKLID